MREAFGGMPLTRIALETGMHLPRVSRVLSELVLSYAHLGCGEEALRPKPAPIARFHAIEKIT
jgi:hypothetical protein